METIKTELVAGTTKRDRRGRKILSEAQWRETLASYERSELTQREFCRREGINLHTFVGRRWRHRRSRPAVVPAFLEAKLPNLALAGSGYGLEVVLPGGVIVRGRQALDVAALVRVLGGR
jgi:hypothetical protein